MVAARPKPVVLLILDGWGHREDPADNALAQAELPHWRRLWAECPHTLVHTEGRHVGLPDGQMGNSEVGHMHGAPVVALVDAGSASATEVLSGALRDLHRAKIVGSRTFGKGLVQTLLPLDNGDSVKLTTARYYTPSGKSIQGVGIIPDLVLKPDKATAQQELEDGDLPYTEASLPGHLRGEDESEDEAGTNAGDVLPGDAPIAAALQELKGPVAQAAVPTPKG